MFEAINYGNCDYTYLKKSIHDIRVLFSNIVPQLPENELCDSIIKVYHDLENIEKLLEKYNG